MGRLEEKYWQGAAPRIFSLQGDIVCVRTKVNTFDVAYLTRTDIVLPLHAHDQSHSGNVTKCYIFHLTLLLLHLLSTMIT